ncbi:VOC family protein [Mangrovimicrobium sediminis]|uniref:VOC family protein n=2 Tax=Mangrovimicrobium sediminis TaxID=2562682 RepID=A0A4Z0LYU0_9GAMM|nr:VOC family protein [Haliea sp. SAOS-164]
MQDANPLNLTHIDHVVIRARDIELMVAFYRDVLGCRLERGPGELGLAQLRAGLSLIDLVDVETELGRAAGDPPDGRAPNMDHVCFQVEPWDVAAITAHLDKHGVEYGPVESRYGAAGQGPSIYLRDPEGNTLELKGRT